MQSIVSILARLMLVAIFLMSAVGNKIPNFQSVSGYMASAGIPLPDIMLVGAIVFMIAGSVSLILGYRARLGALLLLVFLALATYFFHDFWNKQGDEQEQQMIQFLKNLSMMGAMLFVIANGAGAGSLDARRPAAKG